MQFIDRVEIEVEGGKGGDGITAWRREKYVPAGGPAGGDGGHGGSVMFRATDRLQTLLDFKYKRSIKADDGKRGGSKNCTGASGEDLILDVPCGTIAYDLKTNEVVCDLITDGQTACVAEGGKGGNGNRHYLSNRNRAPEYSQEGAPGRLRELRLELKLLAEVGIIGLPNAGKSTLISSVSAAKPKIADYPFTTLIPNLGVVRKPTGDGTVFADIPGLIEGAHTGAGLGHDFLRHIERTRLLLHLVDITAEDPIADYRTIQGELVAYGHGLDQRPQIVAFNKMDACDRDAADLSALMAELKAESGAETIFAVSAVARTELDRLLRAVWDTLDRLDREAAAREAELAAAAALQTPLDGAIADRARHYRA
jgi:GTP-binding protein